MGTYTTRRVDLFDGSSGQSSTYTSDWHLVADWNIMAVSWYSDTTSSSLLTISGSLDDGLNSAIANTSTITTVTVGGAIYTIDPGVRWLRAERGSEDSLSIVQLQLQE